MNTKEFTLPSGVKATIKELTGKHQRMLTEQKHKNFGENLNDVLADILVKVGDITIFDIEFVKAMLSEDRRWCLVQARLLSIDEPEFVFNWEYLDGQSEKQVKEVDVELTEESFNMKPYAVQAPTYSEIVKDVTITLPSSGKKCVFKMLDGFGEEKGQITKKAERSSHTPLIMRNIRIEEIRDGKAPLLIQANLDNMSLRDIEYLRKQIKATEGKVDTEIMFEHPEAETQSQKTVVVDLLSVKAFFFPSEAI